MFHVTNLAHPGVTTLVGCMVKTLHELMTASVVHATSVTPPGSECNPKP
jgi:hypothetical protein